MRTWLCVQLCGRPKACSPTACSRAEASTNLVSSVPIAERLGRIIAKGNQGIDKTPNCVWNIGYGLPKPWESGEWPERGSKNDPRRDLLHKHADLSSHPKKPHKSQSQH